MQRHERGSSDGSGPAWRVVAAVPVLAAVAGLAFLAGKGDPAKPVQAAATLPGPPSVGKVTLPVPPTVVFADDLHGYALYRSCPDLPTGSGCRASLWATDDGAASWNALPLPKDAPLDPSAWLDPQAHGSDVVLAWSTAVAVSTAYGLDWHTVPLDNSGSTTAVTARQFLVGTPAYVVDPEARTAILWRSPQQVTLSGVNGGKLDDGTMWARDSVAFGMSKDGVHWNVAIAAADETEVPPLAGAPDRWARVTATTAAATTGQPGDGGEYPAAHVQFSADHGKAWTSPLTVTGPPMNAACTVYLADGDLLGVAVDARSLLRLSPDAKGALERVTAGPVAVPSCLAAGGGLVWGATFDGRLATSTDGAHWTMHALPRVTAGTPVSPTG